MEMDPQAVIEALERVVGSQQFAASRQLQALLHHLVNARLDGTADNIKAYTLALDVFGRSASFDPKDDPIVRVQAGRLRRLLQSYYESSGRQDPLHIDVPKGSYRAEFSIFDPDAQTAPAVPATGQTLPENRISVAVLPFSAIPASREQTAVAYELSDEIRVMLARNYALQVATRPASTPHRGATDAIRAGAILGTRYLVDGSIRRSATGIRVAVQLIDVASGTSLWTERYDHVVGENSAAQDELARLIVSELRHRFYTTAKRVIARKEPGTETAWELFLQATWVPDEGTLSLAQEWEHVARARRALELDPDSGKAHSVLADKLAYLANLDPPSDTAQNTREAAFHAKRALELEPRNADVTFNVSMHYWHAGRQALCLGAARRTLELDPAHYLEAFLVKAIPYIVSPVPRTVISDLIAEDSRLAADNIGRWVTLSWIGMLHLNNNDLEEAAEFGWRAREVYSGRSPETTYWLCAALVGLGETDTALELIEETREYWPTLNLRHYADVVVRRRYDGSEIAGRIGGLYGALAEVVGRGNQRQRRPLWRRMIGGAG